MKKQNKAIAILLMVFLFVGSSLFASFPVNQNTKPAFKTEKAQLTKTQAQKQVQAELRAYNKLDTKQKSSAKGGDDMLILVLLWFFLGAFAAHRWYAGKPVGWNILFILTAGGCGVWAIVDLINILTGDF